MSDGWPEIITPSRYFGLGPPSTIELAGVIWKWWKDRGFDNIDVQVVELRSRDPDHPRYAIKSNIGASGWPAGTTPIMLFGSCRGVSPWRV
jgi:hypothetical protein